MITQERLQELVKYDEVTGLFTWAISRPRCKVGNTAGCHNKKTGYIMLRVDDVLYMAHRLAWLYMTGAFPEDDLQVDHKNRVRNDNSWLNLRIATHTENTHNSSLSKNNTSGVKGVHFCASRNVWQARIGVHGVVKYLGKYKLLQDAAEAVRVARESMHGSFSNHEVAL